MMDGSAAPRLRRSDLVVVALLLVGGFTPFALGWVVGVVLLWRSDTWSSREKLIGTLIVPAGLALPVVLAGIGTSSGSCFSYGGPNMTTVLTCRGGGGPPQVEWVGLWVVAAAGQLASSVVLLRSARVRGMGRVTAA
jgi:hypothetical protein